MPFTQRYSGISLTTIDTYLPEETYTTLNETLLAYGLSANETISITDATWHTLTNSPTAKGSCLVMAESTLYSGIFLLSKNATTNNASKLSSVSSGSVYVSCRWTNNAIEIACINNTASFDLTVSIKT
jgi:hypothetical protein